MRFAAFNPALPLFIAIVACSGISNAPRIGEAAPSSDTPSKSVACDARDAVTTATQQFPAPALRLPKGFAIQTIAGISGARELASLPNGDLIVGTQGRQVYIVPDAEGKAGPPQVFATLDDDQAAGIAFSHLRCEIYVATTHHVWAIPYHGERVAQHIARIANVRSGPVAPGTDGDVHTTTSVAYTEGLVYAAAGSSCNATMDHGKKPCTEVDPTRAAVSILKPNGADFSQRAKRIRNAIALAVNPETHSLWVGGAGQDDLPTGHPYEYLDNLSAHPGDADYGWPECEENHHDYWPGYNCSKTVEPLVELPAYSTIIGATFYPLHQAGAHAFPSHYRGGIFAAVHGSWHTNGGGCYVAPPRVLFVAMNGDRPAHPVDWKNPATQWADFLTGFQTNCTDRIGRPTGISVGPQGSLFVTDDAAGLIYRVRPAP
jgi:glucose/arabinose dehydrogenase